MQKSSKSWKFGAKGFGLIDFVIIGAVISILAFIIITNILARAY